MENSALAKIFLVPIGSYQKTGKVGNQMWLIVFIEVSGEYPSQQKISAVTSQ